MGVIAIFIIILLIIVAFYLYNELESAEQYIFDLESRPHALESENRELKQKNKELSEMVLQAERRATQHFEKIQKIYSKVYQEPNFNSVENLQNIIKTILDDCNSSNINNS